MTNKNLRLIDANLNRLAEGIRVIEDIFRYVLDDKTTATRLKSLRHKSRIDIYTELITSRDIKNDVLKTSTASEQSRKDLTSILIANFKGKKTIKKTKRIKIDRRKKTKKNKIQKKKRK